MESVDLFFFLIQGLVALQLSYFVINKSTYLKIIFELYKNHNKDIYCLKAEVEMILSCITLTRWKIISIKP